MILSCVTWATKEGVEYLTSEINMNHTEALQSILQSIKIKTNSEDYVKIVEFFETEGGHEQK